MPAVSGHLHARAPAHEPPRAAPQAPVSTVDPASAPQSGIAAAFTRSVQASPASTSHISTPSEDWYVGVAGVPVGPIRLSEIREKASIGAVDGDSLVWREGFDEWLQLRNFPELLEIVTEAHSARQSNLPGRRSSASLNRGTPVPRSATPLVAVAVAARARTGQHPAVQMPPAASAATLPLSTPSPMVAAPVAPFGAPPPAPSRPAMTPAAVGGTLDVLSDPFASKPAPFDTSPRQPAVDAAPHANGAGLAGSPFAPLASELGHRDAAAPATPLAPFASAPFAHAAPSIPDFMPGRRRATMHPVAYAFIAMAAAFGGVFAWFTLTKAPPPQPQIVVVQGPGAQTAAPTAAPDPTGTVDVGDPTTTSTPKVGGAPRGDARGGGPPPPAGAPIDTSGFGAPGGPVSGPGPGGTQGSGGGQLSQGEIQGVVTQNQANIRRKCWEPSLAGRSKDGPVNARVNATVKIAPSGNVDSVNASGSEGDFPGLSSCIASKIKGWKFPASGGTTTVNVPFVFAAQ